MFDLLHFRTKSHLIRHMNEKRPDSERAYRSTIPGEVSLFTRITAPLGRPSFLDAMPYFLWSQMMQFYLDFLFSNSDIAYSYIDSG